MRTVFSLLILVATALGSTAHAQLDPSTALLVRRPLTSPVDFDARRPAQPRARIVITPAEDASVEAAPIVPAKAPIAYPRFVDLREPASEPELHEETLSVRFSAGYLNLDSTSSFAPRAYSGGGAFLGLGMTLWATPSYGVRADYHTSLSADVRAHGDHYGLDHQEVDAAAVYRHPWGSSSWDFGVGYHQISNAIARGAQSPHGSRSRGADASLGLDLRGGADYVHRFEVHVQPVLAHDELGLRDGVGSGASNTSYGASAVVGGRYAPSHQREYFWRLKYMFEQNSFSGGRTVTSGQARLSFGLSWGS